MLSDIGKNSVFGSSRRSFDRNGYPCAPSYRCPVAVRSDCERSRFGRQTVTGTDVGLSAREVGADARVAIEILKTEEPIFNELAASVPFTEYVLKEGIAFA
jgi:hypothetical protein